ncbi:3-methyl-2-oxobutanoate hydroxymethyltransferase [Candidatus Bathyarchaeota archaeon]|nr:3-methyl-2-oxobutanoate hydroxymethyltransferase [Candidatus Bathyarchaeota archaeon]
MEFQDRIRRKKGKQKIVMLTAYDCQMAKVLDKTNIDLILVGDSLGMVVQGHVDTKSVTMTDMIYHTKAVANGTEKTPIIGDMPMNSYNTVKDALENARKFLKAGAHGVKIEGNSPEVVRTLIDAEIPVMGHVGMLPQKAKIYRVKGKEPEEAEEIYRDAISLDELGVFSTVLECIPESLARRITMNVENPTIGIGAGRYCDGQVLVVNDMLGFDESFAPKFVKRYAHLGEMVKKAVAQFVDEVSRGAYPDEEHTYH